MKLSPEQIIAMTNGIIRTEQNDLGVEMHRFSRTQEGFFYQTHPHFCKESFFNGYFGRNCRTCAGVTLDFICDASEIHITFGKTEIPNDAPPQQFDLHVDNAYACSFALEESIHYTTSGGIHQYTLYLPYFAFPIISQVELSHAALFRPIKQDPTILFLGDSITHGVGAEHPANTYVCRVARHLGVGILNQGNSGFVYDAGSLERVCDPKIIVTAYGINDYSRKTLEQLESETDKYLVKLRSLYPDAIILSILPLWTAANGKDPNFGLAQRACLQQVYKKRSDIVVDGFEMIPNDKTFFADDAHPLDQGYACYGENLSKVLRALLRK